MFSSSQFDGGASVFSGGGFMSSQSQATQIPDSGFSKNRGPQGVLPLTVKQISEAYNSSDNKSNLVVDGVETINVRLLGLVMNKAERVTDVTFTLDDGTGRVDVIKWTNETSDTNETAVIKNGMYVTVTGSLKGFQGKRQVGAFSIRPVNDYNEIALHFIQCISVHLENTRQKIGGPSQFPSNTVITTPVLSDVKGHQTPVSNTPSVQPSMGGSETDIYKIVLDVFQEPASLASDHGIHVDDVVRKTGIPINKIKSAIDYHVDVGHIYSTIDDHHYKSACTG